MAASPGRRWRTPSPSGRPRPPGWHRTPPCRNASSAGPTPRRCRTPAPPRWHRRGPRWLAARPSELDVLDLLGPRRRGAEQEGQVGAGRDIARAHPHILRHQIGAAGEAADAAILAVLAAGIDHGLVDFAH